MLLKLRALAVCTVVFLAIVSAAHAATLNVGPGQTYTTIQSAINAASPSDTVSVAPGTYTENIDFKSKSIIVISTSGAATTIIDGGGLGPVVTITGASANGATLNGFTIQNGGKPQSTGGPQGGIYINGAAPSIYNSIITKTFCSGIFSTAANPFIYGNDIKQTLTTGCAAQEGLGSGVTLTGSMAGTTTSPTPQISRNTIELNTASVSYSADKGGGAAINITNAVNVILHQNILRYNTTTGYAGAMYVATTPQLVFDDNLVYGNKGVSGGLDIVVPGSSVGPVLGYITNNTLLDNQSTAANGGSEIYIGGNLAQYVLANNIIVGYSANDIAVNCGTTYASQTITPLVFDHNDIYSLPNSGNTPVGGACTSPAGKFGNISADPKFVNATAAAITAGTADFHLTAGSPAVDSGNNSVLFVSADLDSNPRLADATGKGYVVVDMGVYELPGTQDTPSTTLFLRPSTYSPTVGGSLTLSANLGYTVTGIPSGSVTFYEDNASIGTGSMSSTGTVTLAVTNLTAGTHTFYAVYPGQGSFAPATSLVLYLLVGPATTGGTTETLVSSVNPSAIGQSVTFTVHLASANGTVPAGTVTFTDGPNTFGGVQLVDSSGNASVSVSNFTPGNHAITAAFTPSGTFTVAATASLTQVVAGYLSQAVLTVNPTSAASGAPVTLIATVTPVGATLLPTGNVNFSSNTLGIGSAALNASGIATLTVSNLPAGLDQLTCDYVGDTNFPGAPCNFVPVTIAAAPTALTLTSSANPSPAATPITFTATLTSNGQPVPNAIVTLTLNTTPGTSVNVTTNASGVATYTSLGLAAGTYFVTASTPATSSYNASAAPTLTEVVNANASTLYLSTSANPSPALAPITFTVVLSSNGQPSANQALVLTLGTTPVTTVTLTTNASGTATYTSPGLQTGTYPVTATFAATGSLLGQHASLIETVVANPTTTSLTASPNPSPQSQPVTLTATVHASTGTASPDGNVTFYDGATPIGFAPVTASGVALSKATLTTTTLAPGIHSLTAQYLGDLSQSFLPSQSSAFSETVLQQDFTFTSASPTLTISTGHKGTLALTLASIGSFAGPVSISCSAPLPQYVTCEPPALTLAPNATATGNLTLDTNRILNFYGANHAGPLPTHNTLGRIALASLLPLTLFLGLQRRRRTRARLTTALTLTLLATLATALTGCTGYYPATTPPGTYPITLSATGTPNSTPTPTTHTLTITLIVTR